MEENLNRWSEGNSKFFIDYGKYLVPGRELQIETICSLIKPGKEKSVILELCCGEGLLAEAILKQYNDCTVIGLDGSEEMLDISKTRLKQFGNRFKPVTFDLNSKEWRNEYKPVSAVVSSLAIHHLSGEEKKELFNDVYLMLDTGGSFVIADIILPASEKGNIYAANLWDKIVKERSLEIDSDIKFFETFEKLCWNYFKYPDDIDKPSTIFDQLLWLKEAGFTGVDVFWLKAGHAVYGGFRS